MHGGRPPPLSHYDKPNAGRFRVSGDETLRLGNPRGGERPEAGVSVHGKSGTLRQRTAEYRTRNRRMPRERELERNSPHFAVLNSCPFRSAKASRVPAAKRLRRIAKGWPAQAGKPWICGVHHAGVPQRGSAAGLAETSRNPMWGSPGCGPDLSRVVPPAAGQLFAVRHDRVAVTEQDHPCACDL